MYSILHYTWFFNWFKTNLYKLKIITKNALGGNIRGIDHRALRLMISTVRTQMCSHAMIICLGCNRFVHTISTYIHCDIPLECTNGTTLCDGWTWTKTLEIVRAMSHESWPSHDFYAFWPSELRIRWLGHSIGRSSPVISVKSSDDSAVSDDRE